MPMWAVGRWASEPLILLLCIRGVPLYLEDLPCKVCKEYGPGRLLGVNSP